MRKENKDTKNPRLLNMKNQLVVAWEEAGRGKYTEGDEVHLSWLALE